MIDRDRMGSYPVSEMRSLFVIIFCSWSGLAFSQTEEEDDAKLPSGIITEHYDLRLKGHKNLNLYLRYPSSGKKPVKGVIALCKYGERDIQMDLTEGSRHFGHILKFADEFQFATVAFGQPSTKGWNKTVSSDQLSNREASAQDRNLDALAREWSRTISRFARKYELPEKDWLLYGICGGAQYAHRIALRQPQHFRAVHVHYGGSYDVPTDEGKSIKWLVTSFSDEPAYIAAQRFYQNCREKDYSMILKGFSQKRRPGETVETDFYGIRSPMRRLSLAFFKYAIEEDDSVEEVFLADFVNGMVLPKNEGEWIPKSQTILLPSRALAEAWGKITE